MSLKVCVVACLYTAGGALLDFGESMKKLSESKDALDINVKHNFIDPLQIVVDQNIKDVQVEAAFVTCRFICFCSKYLCFILFIKCPPHNRDCTCTCTFSTIWRSCMAAAWTMIIRRNVRVKSQTKRSKWPRRSLMSLKSCLERPWSACWSLMWVTRVQTEAVYIYRSQTTLSNMHFEHFGNWQKWCMWSWFPQKL